MDPVFIDAPCSDTGCLNVMEDVADSLTSCTISGVNYKINLQNALSVCTGGGTTTTTTTTTTPTPTSSSTTECTAAEYQSTEDLYDAAAATSARYYRCFWWHNRYSNSVIAYTSVDSIEYGLYDHRATSDECAADSTVNDFSVYIFTTCDSECVDKIKDLAEGLPNCYYDYEFMNKKQDVLEELDKCASSNYYLTVTIFPDSTVDDTVTSTSTPISTPSGGSETLAPESGELPDTTLDSSTTGAESDTPQIFASSFQVMAIVVAAVFLTF
eukprot:jgi/Phyca11/16638/fgenesh1_pg.PHYCAscaffold_21_\